MTERKSEEEEILHPCSPERAFHCSSYYQVKVLCGGVAWIFFLIVSFIQVISVSLISQHENLSSVLQTPKKEILVDKS